MNILLRCESQNQPNYFINYFILKRVNRYKLKEYKWNEFLIWFVFFYDTSSKICIDKLFRQSLKRILKRVNN